MAPLSERQPSRCSAWARPHGLTFLPWFEVVRPLNSMPFCASSADGVRGCAQNVCTHTPPRPRLLTVVSRSDEFLSYRCHLICGCPPSTSVRWHFTHFSSPFPLAVGIRCDKTQARLTVWVWAKEQPKQGNCSATAMGTHTECCDIPPMRENPVFMSNFVARMEGIRHIYVESVRVLIYQWLLHFQL